MQLPHRPSMRGRLLVGTTNRHRARVGIPCTGEYVSYTRPQKARGSRRAGAARETRARLGWQALTACWCVSVSSEVYFTTERPILYLFFF